MQNYQNFYPMNNGYVQNPYAERMNFLQNCQQNLQPPMQNSQMQATSQQTSFIGKVVDSIDVVKATDIPMDGNIYYFPKADGTEIFGKQWLMNGQTQILTLYMKQQIKYSLGHMKEAVVSQEHAVVEQQQFIGCYGEMRNIMKNKKFILMRRIL